MLGRSALLAATNSENYGNWLGNYSDVSLLLRNGTPLLVPFDESPTPKTITSVGNASVTTAIAKWNQGSGGSSLAFDGNGDYLTAPIDSAFEFGTGDFTVECWVRFNSVSNFQRFAGIGRGASTSAAFTGWSFYYYLNTLYFYRFDGAEVNVNRAWTPVINTWYHIVASRSGTSLRLFVDGVQLGAAATSSTSYNRVDNENFEIGRIVLGAAPGTSYFLDGYIDDLRITKGIARYVEGTGANAGKMVFAGTNDLADPDTFGELQTNSGPNPDPNWNSVSLLLRNGTPLLVPFDESPTPKTITSVGNASATTAVARWNQGSGGSSMAFDGSGDYLSISSNADFAFAGDFTVEAWGYLSSVPGGLNAAYMTDFRNASAGNAGFTFGVIGSSGNARMYQFVSTGVDVTGSSNVPIGAWNHLAYVRSGSTVTMYLNGVSQGSLTSSFSQAATPLIIGARFNTLTEYWHGYIDDLRITKGIARYTSNFTPPTTELPANVTDDPSYNSVSLLLRGNGTPLLVPFDESPTPKTITAVGNAGISTTVFRYGTSSLAFDGSGDRLELPASSAWDFSGGPHTIECWIRLNAYPSGASCRVIMAGANNVNSSFIFLAFGIGSGIPGAGMPVGGSAGIAHTSTIPLSQWVHYALVLNGATTRMFVDGIGVTASVTMPTSTSGNGLQIGYDTVATVNAQFNGYIDDLRITKGIARYTSNFTPPPAELPNF